jgi:O-antigen/teichoic acid export membrane protein
MNIKKLASFSFGPLIGALFGFLTLPLLAWYFSPDDVGRFSMLQVTLSLSVMFFSLSLHQSYVREYNEASDKGQLLALSFWPGVIVLLLIIVFIEILEVSVSKIIFGGSNRYLDYAIYLGLLLSLVINALSHVLRMQERGIAFSMTQIVPRVSLLIFVALLIMMSAEYNFRDIVFSNVLALLCSSLLFIYLIRKDITHSISTLMYIDWHLLKKMLKFALPLIVGGMAYWALTAIDRVFIQKYAGFERLGIYAVATAIAASATVLTSIFSTLWHPIVYRWAKDGVEVERVQSVIDYVFIAVLLIWSLVGIFSGLISFILPPLYADVQYLLVTCFSVPLLYLVSETTMVGIGISRKSNYAMLASIVALLVSILLNYLLVPSLAERGAAISSMFAFAAFFIVRTEATCYLWAPLQRKKIYLLLFVYIVSSVIFSLIDTSLFELILVWFLLMIASGVLYRKRVGFAVNIMAAKCFI